MQSAKLLKNAMAQRVIRQSTGAQRGNAKVLGRTAGRDFSTGVYLWMPRLDARLSGISNTVTMNSAL